MSESRPARFADPKHGASAIESLVGPQLVMRLLGLLKAIRMYDLSNQAVREQLDQALRLIAQSSQGELVLVAMGQCFYLNGVRVRAEPSQATSFNALTAEFEKRNLLGLRFLDGLDADELAACLKALIAHPDAERAAHLSEALAAAGVVRAVPVTMDEMAAVSSDAAQTAADASPEGERERARETHGRAVQGARDAIRATAKSGRPALRRVKRVVQPIVDTIMRNEYSVVGLTAIKSHDEYTYAHCVNVSILSVAIGQCLGLSRPALANLGVAALLHDLGKLTVPADVLGKPGKLTPEEWARMVRHPIEGMKMVARMPGLSPLTVDMMNVSLQHHRMCDGKGYPRAPGPVRLATTSRIVAAADCFDAMTAHREYRQRPFTGYQALQLMMSADRGRFDPAVLWALVKTVGLYPAGTLMRTADGFLVLSLHPNPKDSRRPVCRVLSRSDGTTPSETEPEIWDPMPSEFTVASVVSPDEFEGEVDQLLAA
jgi:HD-GYP domain-containing protein (c-di-GMP phosphodiesterase class II)